MSAERGTSFSDAVSLWRLSPSRWMEDVIDGATDLLVDGLDSPSLRVLAGASPRDSHFELDELILTTIEELGMSELLKGDEQLGALKVILRRMLAGSMTPRETAKWSYTQISFDGGPECDVFVNMDNQYDEVDSDWSAKNEETVDAWMRAEAEALLSGRPSPGPPPEWQHKVWPPIKASPPDSLQAMAPAPDGLELTRHVFAGHAH